MGNSALSSFSTSMPIRFFCEHCRQMLKIGTSKMGSVVDCPRCHKPVVVPPQSLPQAEQLYQMLKNKRAKELTALPVPNNIVSEPTAPESAWDELGGNVEDADLNQWIDELWKTQPHQQQQESFSAPFPMPIQNAISDEEVALIALQKKHKLTVTLLYVLPAVSCIVGLIFGILIHAFYVPLTRSPLDSASTGRETNEITGTIYYHNKNGDRWADFNAVIICLPMDQPTAQLFASQCLSPDDPEINATAQLIQEMGGMYARADVNGNFSLPYREGIRYFVVVTSAHQLRAGEMRPSVVQELRRYFRAPESFGENCLFTDEYEWSGGKYLFRHTFEIQN